MGGDDLEVPIAVRSYTAVNARRRAHGREPASMQCGGPVASPDAL